MLRNTKQRLPALEPPYEPAIEQTLARMMGGLGAAPLALFRTVAHNPHVLDRFRSTGAYLLNFGTVDPLEREIVIHRTCARCGSEYEWGVHAKVFGSSVGLSEAQLAATVHGSADDPAWSERQRLLIALVDALHDSASVPDPLWSGLAAEWSPEQLVELVTLVGQYHLVSFLTNAFVIPHEPFAERFPAAA